MPRTEVKARRQKGDGMEETREYYADIIVDISHENWTDLSNTASPKDLKVSWRQGPASRFLLETAISF